MSPRDCLWRGPDHGIVVVVVVVVVVAEKNKFAIFLDLRFFSSFTFKMTSKFKFDLIRLTLFWGEFFFR